MDLRDAPARPNRAILADQDAIHVLKAEWAFLGQPSRLADLSRRYLDLAPLGPAHLGTMPPPPPPHPKTTDPAPARRHDDLGERQIEDRTMKAQRSPYDDNPCKPRHFKPPPCAPAALDEPAQQTLEVGRTRLLVTAGLFAVAFAVIALRLVDVTMVKPTGEN